jgi:hypothetical protein
VVRDFCQLPPVGAVPLYARPRSNASAAVVRGVALWKAALNCAVILEKAVRQADDPAFANILDGMRYGRFDDAAIAAFHARIIGRDGIEPPAAGTLIVVPTNSERVALNNAAVAAAFRSSHASDGERVGHIYLLKATIEASRGAELDAPALRRLSGLPDSETGRMATRLLAFCGMPVMVLHNVNVSVGIANGTEAIIERIVFPAHAQYNMEGLRLDSGEPIMVHVPTVQPRCIIVRLVDGRIAELLPSFNGLEQGSFPLFPLTISSSVRLSALSHRSVVL